MDQSGVVQWTSRSKMGRDSIRWCRYGWDGLAIRSI